MIIIRLTRVFVVPPVLKPIAQYIDNQLLKLLNILNLEQKMFHLEQVLFQPLLNLTEVNSELFSIIFYRFLKLSILISVTFSPTWGKEEFTHEGRKLVSGKDIG